MFGEFEKKMKNRIGIGCLFLSLLLLVACSQTSTYKYFEHEPMYLSWEEFRTERSVWTSNASQMSSFGKIYTKGNYLYINEPNVGIHVFDNSDVNNPVKKTFLQVVGNVDLAIRGNRLYADSFTDLLVFDISDLNNITLVKRESNSFPYNAYQTVSPDEENPPRTWNSSYNQSNGVIINWLSVEREGVYSNSFYFGGFFNNPISPSTAESSSGGDSGSGQGGSFARFQVVDDYLYTLTDRGIAIFEIDIDNNPFYRKEIRTPSSAGIIETLYYYSNTLFVGSTLGMFISDISDRDNPGTFSSYTHFQACDPVVVQGQYAYVTLRSGTGCNNPNVNELHVVNISNIRSPKVVNPVYNLNNPHGLGVYGDSLFVADGDYGMRWFVLENEGSTVSQIHAITGVRNTYDVIVRASNLILSTKSGIYQYNYDIASSNITEASRILISNR